MTSLTQSPDEVVTSPLARTLGRRLVGVPYGGSVVASCYVMDYAGQFRFAAPPADVWSAIERLDQFERWWGWLGNLQVEGAALDTGCILRCTVAPPVPYRMNIQVELCRCVPGRLIDAVVSGDLAGEGHLWLQPDGDQTLTDVSWSVEMLQRRMRVAARVAYPLLRWGHDRVVDATVRGFRSQIERRP